MSQEEISITLASTNGQSDTISVHGTSTTLNDLMEWSRALLGLSGSVVLFKDGSPLRQPGNTSIGQAGIVNGDLIAVQQQQRPTPAVTPAPAAAGSGGLDFSSLLNSTSAAPAAAAVIPPVTYYPGMHLDDAMDYNPHPQNFVTLVLQHENLLKELNYHNPEIAQKLQGKTVEQATAIWREELVKGSIRGAYARNQKWQKERDMRARLDRNPNDQEAKEYFEQKQNESKVEAQYRQMMENYPETMGRVLMLYIEAKVNDHSIQAFVDSGAQNTIMSKKCATQCGLSHLIDTRFAGTAVGVGTGKILGRIHIVSLQIANSHFPCSVTVMDDSQGLGDKNMDFLLGLDMLKRHLCKIDLEDGCVRFKLPGGQYLEAPFLHEKDLAESKGGTKGFDADRANKEVEEMRRKALEKKDSMQEDDK